MISRVLTNRAARRRMLLWSALLALRVVITLVWAGFTIGAWRLLEAVSGEATWREVRPWLLLTPAAYAALAVLARLYAAVPRAFERAERDRRRTPTPIGLGELAAFPAVVLVAVIGATVTRLTGGEGAAAPLPWVLLLFSGVIVSSAAPVAITTRSAAVVAGAVAAWAPWAALAVAGHWGAANVAGFTLGAVAWTWIVVHHHRRSPRPIRYIVVLMGQSRAERGEVGRLLARKLARTLYFEADELQPPAVAAKSAAGLPLDANDHRAWLDEIVWRIDRARGKGYLVLGFASLAPADREYLRAGRPEVMMMALGATDAPDYDVVSVPFDHDRYRVVSRALSMLGL
jgi:hypothetical protein